MEPADIGSHAVMKPASLDVFVCPACKGSLLLAQTRVEDVEIIEGTLRCPACQRDYPILGGVPRFVDSGTYASSFGRQWTWFRTVQLDSMNGTDESARTLRACTGWSADQLHGRRVLDAGVGAGRFAECAAQAG